MLYLFSEWNLLAGERRKLLDEFDHGFDRVAASRLLSGSVAVDLSSESLRFASCARNCGLCLIGKPSEIDPCWYWSRGLSKPHVLKSIRAKNHPELQRGAECYAKCFYDRQSVVLRG